MNWKTTAIVSLVVLGIVAAAEVYLYWQKQQAAAPSEPAK